MISARGLRLRARTLFLVVGLAVVVVAASVPGSVSAGSGDVGFRGAHFSGTGSAPTGAKPESKLWWNDGYWWASMWDEAAADNFIFRLDPATHTWSNTGVLIDNRSGTRADALWDGTKLYVASHGFTNTAQSGFAARLYRYSYDAGADRYTLDAGFPVDISNWKTETLVIDKDSTGRLWATWVQSQTVYVNMTDGDDRTWGTPFALPVTGAAGLTADDISSTVAFGGNKIGVMWSNQNVGAMYFAVHQDSDPPSSWRPTEAALSGAGLADDHINLKADGQGRVFAAVKTSVIDPDAPLVELLVRNGTTGAWKAYVYGRHSDHHTRPIVVLDEVANVVRMFATSGEAGGTIYQKTAPMDAISFPSGLGTPFIKDAGSADVNDATSTKQLVNATTGVVVLASNDTTGYFWHNEFATDTGPPLTADFTGSPISGDAPLTVAFNDASTGTPSTWVWNFGDGGTSSERNPTHTFAAVGTYSVTLSASDGTRTSTRTRTNYITVGATSPLAADFTGTPLTGAAPLQVTFTDASSGLPVAWSWNFGDGGTAEQQNPPHTYASPGTYTVTLTVTNSAASTSTRTRTAYVSVSAPAPPTASFVGSPASGTAPLTVGFTDTSTGAPTSWTWDFGDGTTSTQQSPTHTYAGGGRYTVTLTVTNGGGSNTATKLDYINVDAPPTLRSFTPVADAWVSQTSATTNHGGDTTLRVKNGGTASTSKVYQTLVKFDLSQLSGTLSSVKLRLYVVDPGTRGGTVYTTTSGWTESGVTWSNAPPAGTALGTVGATTVRDAWVEVSLPTSAFPAAGVYSLKIQVASSDGTTWYSSREGAHAPELVVGTATPPVPPSASFTATPLSGAAPLAVTLTDTSTGSPTSWTWGFGDGSTSALRNPTHTYTSAGEYTVTLTASNAGGSNTAVRVKYIVVAPPPPPPTASFTGTPTSGAPPLDVSFTDTSTGTPTAWAWDFGDGTTSMLQNPAHRYGAAGTYTVTLTATNAGGSATATRAGYVTVSAPPAPTASFTGSPTSGEAPLDVAFSDASVGGPTGWSWDFGDGATSSAQNPTHTYTAAGTYDVTLTATNASGSDTLVRSAYIAVSPPSVPTASFIGTPFSGAAPLRVAFSDTSTGEPTSWSWDFGDGSTSAERNPVHSYVTPGTYTVSLVVANALGSDTRTRVDYVTVHPEGSEIFTPVADAYVRLSTPTANSGTATTLRVKNPGASGDAFKSYLRFAVSSLVYPVVDAKLRLHVVDAGGGGNVYSVADTSWSETGVTWNNAPAVGAALGSAARSPLGTWVEIPLPASAFAAGNGAYTLAVQSDDPTDGTTWYSSREGENAPELIITTAPPPPPTASFTGSPTSGTAPLAVAFTDTSTGDPTGWSWDFGDGATSTLRSPAHTYTTPGVFTVTLTATNGGGSHIATRTNYITVSAPPPFASFTASPLSGAAPLAVAFTDTSSGSPTSWSWSFGDGATSTEQAPSHTYTAPGTYTVGLTVGNAGGTSTVIRDGYITVAPPPVTFTPQADSHVRSASPTSNFGTTTTLRVKYGGATAETYRTYIRFAVSGLVQPVSGAKLRLYVVDPGNTGGNAYAVADNSWTETGLTWNNAPTLGALLAHSGPAPLNTWIELALPTSFFAAGNGQYTIAMQSDLATDGTIWYASRETTTRPELVLAQGTP